MPRSPKAIVLQHIAHEGPGRVLGALERAGFQVEIRNLAEGEPLPGSVNEFDALVVMGGPMGVGDLNDARYPFLAPEVELLRECVARERPVLGICLGAQLLAHAAGARVYPLSIGEPSRRLREVGWGAVHFARSSDEEPILEGLNPAEIVLHWHGDTFDLPPGAQLLASSLHCENQMFRLGKCAFGLQFHIELEAGDILRWLDEDAEYVERALGVNGRERILSDTPRYMSAFRAQSERLLDGIVGALWAGSEAQRMP